MKKISLLPILLFSLFATTGCKTTPHTETGQSAAQPHTLFIQPESGDLTVKASDIASAIQIIPLETRDSVWIGEVQKIIRTHEYIYVSDGETIYIFNESGYYIRQFNKQGSAPDQYAAITAFQPVFDHTFWILDDNRLLHYTFDGELTQTIPLSTSALAFELWDDSRLLIYSGNETSPGHHRQLQIISLPSGLATADYLDTDTFKAGYLQVSGYNNFNKTGDGNGYYFFEMFNDTIYRLARDTFGIAFDVNIAGKNIPTAFYARPYKNILHFYRELYNENYAYGTELFGESSAAYFYFYYYENQGHLAFFYKKEQEQTCFTSIAEDQYLGLYPISLTEQPLFVQQGNQILLPLYPNDIMGYAEDKLTPQAVEAIRLKINYTGDQQNPILVYLEIK